MSGEKRKDSKVVEFVDPHVRESHLAEGIEKHGSPVFAPVSVNPMPSQLIAHGPLLAPSAPPLHQKTKTVGEEKGKR